MLTALVCPRATSLSQGFIPAVVKLAQRCVRAQLGTQMVEQHYLLTTAEEKTCPKCSPGGISEGRQVTGGHPCFQSIQIFGCAIEKT